MQSLTALFLALGATLPSVSSLGTLSSPLTCGPSGPVYSVSLDGSPLLTGAPPLAIFVDGALETSFTLETAQNVTGSDTLGPYSGTTCVYSRASSPTGAPFFIASVFTYPTTQASPASTAIRFHYTFPQGASGTNFSADGAKGAHHATISNFPAFTSGPLLPNSLTWQDSFFPSQQGNVAYGMAGGPLLSYGQDVAGVVTVLSPLDNFLTSSLGDWQAGQPGTYCPSSSAVGCWSAGTASTVTSLPPGFSHSWLLLAGAHGITDTMTAWGGVMKAYYGATSTSLTDASLTGLGYQTDNGAQLCFGCPGQVLDACLLGEKGYLDSVGVPVQYLSFQNAWWKSGGESAPWCVGEWEAVPAKVPMGIPAFQKALGLPLQLYAPYFCATSSYPANFSMVRSDTSLPGCDSFDFWDAAPESSRLFYDFLFDLGQSYGMTMFEPDFLNQNHNCQPRFISEVGAAEGFFGGQASAALARGIPIQWCFCTPYLLMWTLNAPAITNFRVSYDFFYGGSWDIGTTSLLVMSLGKAPSKDTFWTSDNGAQATTRGGCDKKGCPPDHTTPAAELHTLLALMTTGPVGFSDAPNETDATLILRTCDSAGNLLQPSRPITSVDSTQVVGNGGAPKGYVLSTHTLIPGNLGVPGGAATAYFILAHQLTAPYTALVRDLWPPPARGLEGGSSSSSSSSVTYGVAGDARILRGEGGVCPPGASASSCSITLLPPLLASNASTTPILTFPAVPQGVDPFTPALAILAPLCPSSGGGGLTFFGEVGKFATISTQRFLSLVCGAGGEMGVRMAGQGGEQVRVRWVKWVGGGTGGEGTLQEGLYTFPQGGAKGNKEVACTIPATGDSLTCE